VAGALRWGEGAVPRRIAPVLHRLSTSLIRTLREDPADAEVASHRLLVRACYVRRAAPGVYTWLPLGLRTLRKIEDIVRQEMDAMGGQEVHFPALLPAEPYQATGRWDDYGPTLFKLRDRKDGDYLLAPTHEEMFTLAVKDLYSSYKDLPAIVYQIQTKYRDEARPRAGIIRGREFVMKDSYSFDMDEAGLDASYQLHRDAYERIFARLGLDYIPVNATAGATGGRPPATGGAVGEGGEKHVEEGQTKGQMRRKSRGRLKVSQCRRPIFASAINQWRGSGWK